MTSKIESEQWVKSLKTRAVKLNLHGHKIGCIRENRNLKEKSAFVREQSGSSTTIYVQPGLSSDEELFEICLMIGMFFCLSDKKLTPHFFTLFDSWNKWQWRRYLEGPEGQALIDEEESGPNPLSADAKHEIRSAYAKAWSLALVVAKKIGCDAQNFAKKVTAAMDRLNKRLQLEPYDNWKIGSCEDELTEVEWFYIEQLTQPP